MLKAKARGSPNGLGRRGRLGQDRANRHVSDPLQEIQTQAYASLGYGDSSRCIGDRWRRQAL